MDQTQRLAQLLGAMRRERNGAVADAMRVCGRPCGLNYGVSLPTVRQIACVEAANATTTNAEERVRANDAFARYLWRQDVRELRLAALHLASDEALTPDMLPLWEEGIINSELAEEAAFALIGRSTSMPGIAARWIALDAPLLQYAALLAAARRPDAVLLDRAMALLRTAHDDVLSAYLIPRGVVAFLVALAGHDKRAVLAALASLGETPSESYVREEMTWRMEG